MNWKEIFTKENYRHVKASDIVNYVKEEKPEYLEELTEKVKNEVPFTAIKSEFFKNFFPDEVPNTSNPDKKTMRELLGLPPKEKTKNSKKK